MPDLSWHKAINKVLGEAKEPLHYTQIAEEVAKQGLRKELGATPAASVAAELSTSLKNEGDSSPFEKVNRGVYRLRGQKPKLPAEPATATKEEEEEPETGLINALGMYWFREAEAPRLAATRGLTVDFSEERGVYLLHDRREVVYVGRTTDQAMGHRLKQHTTDRLSGRWDRLSWFGILPVKPDGSLATGPSEKFNIENLIATMEALLIEGLEPPQNRKKGDGFRAVEFIQVVDPEIEKRQQQALMDKLKSKL